MRAILSIIIAVSLLAAVESKAQVKLFTEKLAPADSLLRAKACRMLKMPYEVDAPVVRTLSGYLVRDGLGDTRSSQPASPTGANAMGHQETGVRLWDVTVAASWQTSCSALAVDGAGNMLLGGSIQNSLGMGNAMYDYWAAKVTKADGKTWERQYGEGGASPPLRSNDLSTIVRLRDGGYLLAGSSNGDAGILKTQPAWSNSFDYWIVVLDKDGMRKWDRRYGGLDDDILMDVVETDDGGFLLVGYTYSDTGGDKLWPSFGYSDGWVMKLDANGDITWQNVYGTAGPDWFNAATKTADGGYMLAGGTGNDYWLVKLDGDVHSNKGWSKQFKNFTPSNLTDVIQTRDGGYVVVGTTNPMFGDYAVLKTDSKGVKQWSKTLGGNSMEICNAVVESTDGDLIIAGSTYSPAGGDVSEASIGMFDYWLVSLSEQGDKHWDKRFGGADNDILEDMALAAGNTYLLAGNSTSGASADKTSNDTGPWIIAVGQGVGPTSTISVCGTPVTVPNDLTICEGQSADLSLLTPGMTAVWEIPDDAEPERIGTIQGTFLVSPKVTTTYKVTLSKSGCTPVSWSLTVTVASNPSLQVTGNDPICPGETLTLEAAEVPGATYLWLPGDVTTRTYAAAPQSYIRYTLTITGSNGCTTTDSFLPDFKSKVFAGMDQTICVADEAVLVASDADQYQWSTGESTQQVTFAPSAAGTYTFTVTATTAGCSTTDNVVVTVHDNCPGTPAGFTARAINLSQIELDWDEPHGNHNEYVLQRYNHTTRVYETIAVLPAGTTHYSDGNLAEGTEYRYSLYSRVQTYTSGTVYAQARTFLMNMNYLRETVVTVKGIKPAPNVDAPTIDAVNTRIDQLTNAQCQVTWTYYNGLGTVIQSVVQEQSPAGHDVVSPVYFDQAGRSSKQYQPYVVTQPQPGNYVGDATQGSVDFYASPPDKVAQSTAAVSETVFEKSPLGRVLKQGTVGEQMQPTSYDAMDDHTIKIKVSANVAREVLRFTGSQLGNLGAVAYYAAGELVKTATYDDNNRVAIEYKNLNGQLIMKRVQVAPGVNPAVSRANYADTYYRYDATGTLIEIITPEAVKALKEKLNID